MGAEGHPGCVCTGAFVGDACEQQCPEGCNGHGACKMVDGEPTCACGDGFIGVTCALACPGTIGTTCSGSGTCALDASNNTLCNCFEGSSGFDCSEGSAAVAEGGNYGILAAVLVVIVMVLGGVAGYVPRTPSHTCAA
jgi:hypothetical protein